MFCHYGIKERNNLSWSMGKKGKMWLEDEQILRGTRINPGQRALTTNLHSDLRTKANIQHNLCSPPFFFFAFFLSPFFLKHLESPNCDQIDECYQHAFKKPAPMMLSAKSSTSVLQPQVPAARRRTPSAVVISRAPAPGGRWAAVPTPFFTIGELNSDTTPTEGSGKRGWHWLHFHQQLSAKKQERQATESHGKKE